MLSGQSIRKKRTVTGKIKYLGRSCSNLSFFSLRAVNAVNYISNYADFAVRKISYFRASKMYLPHRVYPGVWSFFGGGRGWGVGFKIVSLFLNQVSLVAGQTGVFRAKHLITVFQKCSTTL